MKECRFLTAQFLQNKYHFKTHPKTDTLFIFNDSTYKPKARSIVRRECKRNLGSAVTDHDLREIVTALKDMNYVDKEKFETEEMLIPVGNCDIKVHNDGSFDFMDVSPERIILSRLPWDYKEDAKCPEIKKFLHEILKEDWIPTVQEMMGLCLVNKYITRKAFMLYGDGANGKDVLLEILKTLLGEENVSNHSLHYLEKNRFASASLVGKLANICGDLSEKELKEASVFKKITGRSGLEVEPKGKDSFSYTPYSTMIFAANQTPNFKEDTYALYDRWVIITFPYKFTSDPDDGHKDKVPKDELLAKLTTKEEMEGLLRWSLEGLKRVLRKNGRITNEQPPEEIKEAWQARSDSITAFAKSMVEEDVENVVPKREVYERYTDWCVKNNYTPEAMQTVGKRLPTKSPAKAGQARIHGKKTKVWKGIKIKGEGKTTPSIRSKEKILDQIPDPDEDPDDVDLVIDSIALELDLDIEDDQDKIEGWIDELKKNGDVMEVKPGKIKKV